MIDKGQALRYYKRKEVQELIIAQARNKEVGVQYNGGFGKRPDILVYPSDILELAKRGMSSLHISEETWRDPLELNSNLKRKELDEMRQGWDLLLDIDCPRIEYSKIFAYLVIRFLRYCGVEDISIKFSGSKGFHIGVPFEAFPKKIPVNGEIRDTKDLFPEAPKKIAFYIKENVKDELGKRILAFEGGNINKIKEKINLTMQLEDKDLLRTVINEYGDRVVKLEVDNFIEIDTILIASRHLYRMPYSLHEKLGLVSLPINPDDVMKFEREMAEPEKFLGEIASFMDRQSVLKRSEGQRESARRLLVQAWDFQVKTQEQHVVDRLKEELKRHKEREEIKIESPITEEFFPPCVQQLIKGVEDGRKRAVFILMNFLGQVGWSKREVTDYLLKWNREKNLEPLRENYITGQLRYFKPGEKLPPNCDNDGYYKGMGICNPDTNCGRIKNPANYTLVKWKIYLEQKEFDDKQKAKEERKKELAEIRKEKAGGIRIRISIKKTIIVPKHSKFY
ncbi:MAG: DNA primase small subunit domain-containing protein, partial [archaeon]